MSSVKKEKLNDSNQLNELARLATIVKDSNDAILVLDLKGKITAWNKGAGRIYGYTETEAVKMNITDITPKEKKQEMASFITNIKKGKLIHSLETKRKTKHGKILDVWLTVTKLTDKKGKLYAIATTERDITERKKTVEELRKSYEEIKLKYQEKIRTLNEATKKIREENIKVKKIEQKLADTERLAALGKLAGILGHELRNPISSIRQSIYYLKMLELKDKRIKKHLSIMEEEAFDANRVINDILLFAKIHKIHKTKQDISNALKKIIEECAVTNRIKVIKLIKLVTQQIVAFTTHDKRITTN